MRWFDSVPAPVTTPGTGRSDDLLLASAPAAQSFDRGTPEAKGVHFRAPRPAGDLDVLGPLAAFAAEGVTDLLLNGGSALWIDDGAGLRPAVGWEPLDEPQARSLAVALIEAGGRHLDHASPCVDVRLGAGIRVHAAIPPVSTGGTVLSVRLPSAQRLDLEQLRESQTLDARDEQTLRALVESRANLLITGAAGAGKTTLLAALLAATPPSERIVTVEDVAELQISHPHVVRLECRQANTEGAGAIDLARLVREALRMRPDRIVVGECRGAEIRELLMALGTGHDGGAGTLHARSLEEVPARLEALGALAGLSPEALARLAASSLDVVVHLDKRDGRRVVAEMGRFVLDPGDRLRVEPIAR